MELKACPFCGSPAHKPFNETPNRHPVWVISCSLFCVRMRRGTMREAIADWNHRAEDGTGGK